MLRLWNTKTRAVEPFRSIRPHEVGFYACGPTVYQRAHIGNFRAYIMEDVLRRALEADGFRVKHVMNITDVGHLTDDADHGEDKLEREAARAGKSAMDIAKEYTELFLADMDALHILRPSSLPRATDRIPAQIDLIRILEKRGFTYRTTDGIYFDTAQWPAYGTFSGQPLGEKAEGARVGINIEKRNPSDFALWKFSPTDQKRQMEWDSPWGVGFPGWHVECSAMAEQELGQPFDIHAGGVDHIPVHHENEIAQSEAAMGVPLAHVWFHVEFLLVDGQKMSKSLGNTYSLDDLAAKGIEPAAFRLFILGAHYRQKQNMTWDALRAASVALGKLRDAVRDWDAPDKGCADREAEFMDAIEDDLNTAKALSVVWKLVDSDDPSAAKAESILNMDRVLGLGLDAYVATPLAVPDDILLMAEKRERARAQKQWEDADRIRRDMEERGWIVEDHPKGPKIRSIASV